MSNIIVACFLLTHYTPYLVMLISFKANIVFTAYKMIKLHRQHKYYAALCSISNLRRNNGY